MIAIAIGAIFMGGMAAIIGPALIESGQAGKVQVASTNAQSLLNNVRVWSEGNWNNVLSLATGSTYQYYLITSSSPYTATSGVWSIVIATNTYTTYFYLVDAYRDSVGNMTTASTGNTYDPSTKQIFSVYNWTHGVTGTISTYITRNNNAVFYQTDWSGGANPDGVATSAASQFANSSNIDYSITGSLSVSTQGGDSSTQESETSSSGQNVWVTDDDNNRIEEFSVAGAYIGQFGSGATLGEPDGIAVDSGDNFWIANAYDPSITEYSPAGAYLGVFGSGGSGNGQFNNPGDIAFDANGNMWVVDEGNYRVQEFSASGATYTYASKFGSKGTGNGKFSDPVAVAIDAAGNIWVADAGSTAATTRVEEFTASGTTYVYASKFSAYHGSWGYATPGGLAFDADGNIWMTDSYKDIVEEFSGTGTYIGQFGSSGSGDGQFDGPGNLAIDSGGNIWVTDIGNSRVQEFSATGTYEGQFGSNGSGDGQFSGSYSPGAILIY